MPPDRSPRSPLPPTPRPREERGRASEPASEQASERGGLPLPKEREREERGGRRRRRRWARRAEWRGWLAAWWTGLADCVRPVNDRHTMPISCCFDPTSAFSPFKAAVSCLIRAYGPVLQILTDLADPPGTSFCGRVLEQVCLHTLKRHSLSS